MNIVAIREVFKLQSAFHLPKHKDFTLLNWSDYLKSNFDLVKMNLWGHSYGDV